MKINALFCVLIFSWCILLPYISAKTFSINEALAKEAQKKRAATYTSSIEDAAVESFSETKLNKTIFPQIFRRKPTTKTPSLLFADESIEEKRTNTEKSTAKARTVKDSRTNLFPSRELATAESRQSKNIILTSKPKLKGTPFKHTSLLQRVLAGPKPKIAFLEKLFPNGNKLSLLEFRKSYEIKSPLKSKRSRFPRKFKTEKRETHNGKNNKNYIPLLRDLGILVDDILSPESSDSIEDINARVSKIKYTKGTKDRDDIECTCTRKSKNKKTIASAEKTTITTTVPLENTVVETVTATKTATTTAYPPPASHISGFRQNKNLPSILSRNSSGHKRDNNGFSSRSSTALHRGIKGNIAGYNGNSQYDTASKRNEAGAESNEEYTNSLTRDSPSSYESVRRKQGIKYRTLGGNNRRSYGIENSGESSGKSNENEIFRQSDGNDRKSIKSFQGQNKHKDRRNEAESAEYIPKFSRELRRPLPEDQISDIAEPIQSKEDNEESFIRVGEHSTSDQRFADGSSSSTTENKTTNTPNERVTIKPEDLLNLTPPSQNIPKNKSVVTIIDGYSVARHKHGQNKLTEQ